MRRVANIEEGRVFNVDDDQLDHWVSQDGYKERPLVGEEKRRPKKAAAKKTT